MTGQQMEFMKIAQAQVVRLTNLVADLLDCSRLEANMEMEKVPVALSQVLRASVDNYARLASDAGKTIVVEEPEAVPAVMGDAKWLGLAVDNLVSNAVKFTRSGGRVAVRVADQGEAVQVCVADDGIGIHPDDQGRIFEKFFRARNRSEVSAPGTGLGLTIVKEVVVKHGGRVWFESEMGRGTRFYFTLPTLHLAQDGGPAAASAPGLPPEGGD
jgi:signal transduction histidine kinase